MLIRIALLLTAGALGWTADLGKGMERFKERDYPAAEQEMRAVVEMEPRNAEALRVLGLSLVRQGKSAESIAVLESAVAVGPDFPDAKLALAAGFAAEKRYPEAEKLIDEVTVQKSDHDDLPYYRGMMAVLRKQYKDAVPHLETAIEKDPENGYAYYYAGLAYSNTKRPDKMVGAFNNFLRLEPKSPDAAKVRSFLKASR